MKNSRKYFKNFSNSTMISGSKTSKAMKKYLKCSISCWKGCRSFKAKRRLAKMLGISKLLFKTLGTCLIAKFKAYKKRKLR